MCSVTARKRIAVLEIKNLHVEVDGKKILNGLDLAVEKGSVG
jgi:Fe-S cluster assembly ATP-binding protein